jgi:hypothetical protein
MSRPLVCLVLLTSCAAICASECDGQIIQRFRERRAALLAPPADPAAPPATGLSEIGGSPAEVPPVPPVRGGFLARRLQMRRDLVAQQAALAQPTPASPAPQQPGAAQQTQRTALRPPRAAQQAQAVAQRRPFDALRQASAQVAPALRALSQGEMSQMEVPALQTALANTNGSLSNELNQFSSAVSWQQFFNLPSGVVDEGTIDLAALQTALVRFENVAGNPKFAQIASLPSFNQSRSLLTELVNRVDVPTDEPSEPGDGPQLINPASATELSADNTESLPAPEPQFPRNSGEHSILVRKQS